MNKTITILLLLISTSLSSMQDGRGSTNDVVDNVYARLPYLEGIGDALTEVYTGEYGVTATVRDMYNQEDSVSSLLYLNYLYEKWYGVDGYSSSPEPIQQALLDMSYNVGPSALNYSNVIECLSKKDYNCVLLNTLDVVSVDGGAVIGLAKRRAIYYNLYAKNKVWYVCQYNDGTIKYLDGNLNSIFEYKNNNNNKHEKSKNGTISVLDYAYFWM